MKTPLNKLQKLELISSAKHAVANERAATVFVLEHFFEIEKRRLHIEAGYASLHEFAVTELGYSDGAAYRRIAAMRLMAKVPQAKAAIDSGALSLSNAALVQNVVREAKKQKKEIGVSLFELTKRVESKSARAAEQELRKIVPTLLPKRDAIKIKDQARATITAEVSVELETKLRQLRAKHAHTHGGASWGELLELAVDLALKVRDPKPASMSKRKPTPAHSAQTSAAAQYAAQYPAQCKDMAQNPLQHRRRFSRYVPAQHKRELQRTQPHCQFVSALTQKQCSSTFALEVDHIHPVAKGGQSTAENVQHLCRAHNLWKGTS